MQWPPPRFLRIPLSLLLCTVVLGACGGQHLISRSELSAPLGRAHPLTGRIWSKGEAKLVSSRALKNAVGAASWVLVGETHDNPDHHRLEAKLADIFLASHPGGRVAFEMLDRSQGEALRAEPAHTPDELAERVRWSHSGWPDFAQYRPVFERIFARKGQVVAAHPTREEVRASMHGLSAETQSALLLKESLPPEQQKAREKEIIDSHCGHASAPMVVAMQHAQAFKDAYMARAIAGAPTLLVAGRGHVRKDRGVPVFLARRGLGSAVSVGLVEVRDDAPHPEDYELAPYDYVVFTARMSDEDPCERFREQLEKALRKTGMHRQEPPTSAVGSSAARRKGAQGRSERELQPRAMRSHACEAKRHQMTVRVTKPAT